MAALATDKVRAAGIGLAASLAGGGTVWVFHTLHRLVVQMELVLHHLQRLHGDFIGPLLPLP